MVRIHSNAGGRIGEDDLNSFESGRGRGRAGDSNLLEYGRERSRGLSARIQEGEKMKRNFSLILCFESTVFYRCGA